MEESHSMSSIRLESPRENRVSYPIVQSTKNVKFIIVQATVIDNYRLIHTINDGVL